VRDKGKGRDRKRRRGPKGRKEESVGKNAHKSAHNVSSPAVLSEKPQGLFPAATAVGRASSLPITPEKTGSH